MQHLAYKVLESCPRVASLHPHLFLIRPGTAFQEISETGWKAVFHG